MTYDGGKLMEIEELGGTDMNEYRRDGEFMKFSSNGDTLINAFYRDGRLIGNYYEYYGNGQPKIYRCFDSFHEDTMFYRSYNERGDIIAERGDLNFFTAIYPHDSLDKYTIRFATIILGIPKTSTKVKVDVIDTMRPNDTIKKVNSYFEPFQGKLIYMTCFKGLKPGNYKAYYEVTFNDSAKGKVYNKNGRIDFQR